ncbi:SHOCT domain-containing protein [Nocardia sp. NPDC052566]|uniref:SHOCT domain-containing protein n=1 Tax=Nocardia sp. NPDC052566 TaxID=3364330 RepID=UPI0037CAC6DC
MSFWNVIGYILLSFLFIAYLIVLFAIIADLFHDHDTSGWLKALWVVCLIFLPFITALIYLIVHGTAMSDRRAAEALRYQVAQDEYIRNVAQVDTATQIATARKLLDQGAITQDEFDQIKNTMLP